MDKRIGTKYGDWLELADLNLAVVLRSRMQAIPKAVLLEKKGLMAFSMGPYMDGHLSGIFRYGRENEESPQEMLAICNRFSQSLGYGYIVWIRDHADQDLETCFHNIGLKPRREPGSAGMIIESRLASIGIPVGLEVCKVLTEPESAEFVQVVGAAFGLPLDIARLAIGSIEQLNNSKVGAFIVREKDKAIAAGLVALEGPVAGVYYIGTVPEARGRGLGELCTRITTNAGFDMGAKAVILQASIMGEPLYERLGYKTITHYRWYAITSMLTYKQ